MSDANSVSVSLDLGTKLLEANSYEHELKLNSLKMLQTYSQSQLVNKYAEVSK